LGGLALVDAGGEGCESLVDVPELVLDQGDQRRGEAPAGSRGQGLDQRHQNGGEALGWGKGWGVGHGVLLV
jgi:hypothetical protein